MILCNIYIIVMIIIYIYPELKIHVLFCFLNREINVIGFCSIIFFV